MDDVCVSVCVERSTNLPLLEVFHAADQREVEADSEAVLEEERGAAAVQLTLGDDGDAVAQQVSLVHVVGGEDHRPACSEKKTAFIAE